MGGGTPSLFPPAAIAQLLLTVRRNLVVAPDAEITLEANPGTIERGKFAEYAAAGVNRISLGAQSFDAATLRVLGRVHAPADTLRAVEELRAAGIDNFNLDLMYGLPGQDLQGALRDLHQALQLEPAQLSHYQLTLEPGTVFAATPPPGLPADEASWEMFERCAEVLAAAGLQRYEVSAYARAGRRCAHNLLYWKFGDYLGIGAGAHGKLSALDPQSGELMLWRSTQQRDPRRYQRDPAAGLSWQPVAQSQRPFEFMLNALRLVEGFSRREFEGRTGMPWSAVAQRVERQVARGLLQRPAEGLAAQSDHLQPTARGLRFLNELLLEYLPSGTGT
jgi:oxygen-independent coproporphyrinogen-3 oxidase